MSLSHIPVKSRLDRDEGHFTMQPRFHGEPRYECVVVHDDAPRLTCARLQSLIRCWLPSGKVLDLALIHGFTNSKWKPRTLWKGCRILDEDDNSSIVSERHG
jgi:hypothetical protein